MDTPASRDLNKVSRSASTPSEGWSIRVLPAPETLIFQNGSRYLQEKKDLLLALCLNNGYYNRENISKLLRFALAISKSVQLFTTDGPAKHNYRAFGMSEVELVRKTRLERNRLRNITADALTHINAELPPEDQRSVSFLEGEGVYEDPAYQTSLAYVHKLFAMNQRFKTDVRNATAKALSHRNDVKEGAGTVIDEGVHYLLEELALLLAYQGMSAAGKPLAAHGSTGFNYLYYESWPVFERLVNGEYDGIPKEGIGFVIAKIEET